MLYHKWLSDDGLYMIEKFVGDVSSDIVMLTDEYSLDPLAQGEIKVIYDARHATFERIPLNQVSELSKSYLQVIPKNAIIKLAMVTDPNNFKDSEKIFKYVEGLQEPDSIQSKIHDTMISAYDWLNAPLLITKLIDNKIQEWLPLGDEK